MTWEIVAALITIVGCLIAMGTVLAKFVATLTRIDVTNKALEKQGDKLQEQILGEISDLKKRIKKCEEMQEDILCNRKEDD